MSFSLNRIELIGNLGNDSETRFTTSNKAVTSFSIATTNSYKGKDGNWVNETTWHNRQSWDLPDFYKNGPKKGAKVYVDGRLKKSEYTDKEGIKRYSTDVVTNQVILLDKPEHSSQSSQTPPPVRSGQYDNAPQTGEPDLPF